MVTPNLVIVGTGRCGTKSVADYFRQLGYWSEHEPNMNPTVQLASLYSHGEFTTEEVQAVLSDHTWPTVVSDFKQSELIEATEPLWDARYLWLQRDRQATVDSMVANRWYRQEDDDIPQVMVSHWMRIPEGVKLERNANYPGHRTRADKLGLMTADEWSNLPQRQRCEWWFDWISERIQSQFDALPDNQAMSVSLRAFSEHPRATLEHVVDLDTPLPHI